MQPGDIVQVHNSASKYSYEDSTHVMVYVGNGHFVEQLTWKGRSSEKLTSIDDFENRRGMTTKRIIRSNVKRNTNLIVAGLGDQQTSG